MMKSTIPRPRIVAFEVTHQCRYQCLHCRANAEPEAGDHELTTAQCMSILAALARYRKGVVILTGGEPLERADIYELLEFAFISYQGHIQTCGFLDLSAGNLMENNYDFADIWEHSPLLEQVRDRTQLKGACGKCQDIEVCGGCRARAYALTGDVLAADPICIYH